jgi:hypothetical protein
VAKFVTVTVGGKPTFVNLDYVSRIETTTVVEWNTDPGAAAEGNAAVKDAGRPALRLLMTDGYPTPDDGWIIVEDQSEIVAIMQAIEV